MHRARECPASSNTMTLLFIESELIRVTYASNRASMAFEKYIYFGYIPVEKFRRFETVCVRISFFRRRDGGFVSVSATRSGPRPEGSKLFSSSRNLTPARAESFTVISVPKVDCALRLALNVHLVSPSSFFLALHRAGRPAASSAGIKSRAVIMNDSRGERGYNCDWWRDEKGGAGGDFLLISKLTLSFIHCRFCPTDTARRDDAILLPRVVYIFAGKNSNLS